MRTATLTFARSQSGLAIIVSVAPNSDDRHTWEEIVEDANDNLEGVLDIKIYHYLSEDLPPGLYNLQLEYHYEGDDVVITSGALSRIWPGGKGDSENGHA